MRTADDGRGCALSDRVGLANRRRRRARGRRLLYLRSGRGIDSPLMLDLEADGPVEPERGLVLGLDSEREPAGANHLELGEHVQEQRAPEAAAAGIHGDRERVHVAAAAGQQAASDPADRLAVTARRRVRLPVSWRM